MRHVKRPVVDTKHSMLLWIADDKMMRHIEQGCAEQPIGPCNAAHPKFAQFMMLVTHTHMLTFIRQQSSMKQWTTIYCLQTEVHITLTLSSCSV